MEILPKSHKFNFNDLFIFEMANNHQGSLEHGLNIIRAMADIVRFAGVKGAMKFQFRDLDTFIHPNYKNSSVNKHIPRFLSTKLSAEEFARLTEEVKSQGLISVSTPFDEKSVDLIEKLGIEVIKIASSSATDWPLLERVAQANKPVICSTGGLRIQDIDNVVTFFQHRGVHFALLHCISIYPVPNEKLFLNQIDLMKKRYPGVTVGFSTHEDPANYNTIRLAYAKGARIFEKHVGIPTDTVHLNAYSAAPNQVEAWINAYKESVAACGQGLHREISEKEITDARSLMRGVYLKKEVAEGAALKKTDVFFAMPVLEEQMTSGEFKEGLIADRVYVADEALIRSIRKTPRTKEEIIYSTVHQIKGMLNIANIALGHEFSVELLHQYGINNFMRLGAVLIECVKREYSKKLIVMLSGQWHPMFYHERRDKTLQVLDGALEVEIEKRKKLLQPGDNIWIPRGVWHTFGSDAGAIVEELSAGGFTDDSFYIDREIYKLSEDERKTRLYNWGRHQFGSFHAKTSGDDLKGENINTI